MFLTTFSGEFRPPGGATNFAASREAYMECFEGGRGVFFARSAGGLGEYSMSQTQNPGNPGFLLGIIPRAGAPARAVLGPPGILCEA